MKSSSSFTALVLGIALLASLATPQTANAIPVEEVGFNLVQNTITATQSVASAVADQGTWIKEYVLDPLVWVVGKQALQSMTMSIVNQVTGRGSGGSPQFVTNLQIQLRGVGDRAASGFLGQLSSNGFIRSPFQSAVADIVGRDYYLSTSPGGFFEKNAYTLNAVVENDRAFVSGDFSQGGWNGWFSLIEPQNNFWGQIFLSENELQNQVETARGQEQRKLDWGQGFMSWCGDEVPESVEITPRVSGSGSSDAYATENDDGSYTINIEAINQDTSAVMDSLQADVDATIEQSTADSYNASFGRCPNGSDIKTPGSVVKSGLEKALGTSLDSLVSADEISEILASLFSNLVISVVGGGGGGGLAGISSPRSFEDTASRQAVANIGANFIQTLDAQDDQIDNYETGWQRIGAAADTAKTTLQTLSSACSSTRSATNATLTGEVEPTIAKANASVQKAAGAHAALDDLREQAVNARIPIEVHTAALAYEDLLSSDDLPSPEELAEAISGERELRMQQITEEANAELARCRFLFR